MNNTKKYNYHNVEAISNTEFKWAMLVTALLIAINFEWVDMGEGIALTLFSTLLTTYIWWAFRQYFVKVGDVGTARWLLIIIFTFLFYGVVNIIFQTYFDLGFLWSLREYTILPILFKSMFWLIIGASVAVAIGCLRIMLSNRHHTFPLKRIAISTALFVPLFLIFNSLSTLNFITQVWDILESTRSGPTIYTDGFEDFVSSMEMDHIYVRDAMTGLFKSIAAPFIWTYNLLITIPYLFLLHHFYRADKANSGS